MKVLVTGASGFVGIHLVRELLSDKEIDIYAAVNGGSTELSALLPPDHIIAGDLTDFGYTSGLIKQIQPETIYHLAALSVVKDSVEKAGLVLTSNMLLQYNLLESVRLHSPKSRVLAVCSANEYGKVSADDIPIKEEVPLRPLNPYAVSKVSQDMLAYQYFLAYGLDIVRLRPFNHTGPGQTTNFVIPAFARQFAMIGSGRSEPVVEVGNTESIRDFTDVRDMVRAYVLASAKCVAGEVYNIGFGKGIKIGEIIALFEEISGVKVKVVEKPELVRGADVPVLLSDSTKFRTLTGWEPVIPFKDTLSEVYNYYKQTL